MRFNSISALALLATGFASATAMPSNQEAAVPQNINLALNARAACQPPKNGNKKAGDDCAYRGGEAASSPRIDGKCTSQGGMLICIA